MSNYEQVTRCVNDLIPYANNSRTHSDEQILQIASSIREFGFTNPVLIDEENGIIAGHGRLAGAKKSGLEEVPCIILAGLTEAQKKAYVIADNQIALNSGWDLDLLKVEIEGLDSMGFGLDFLGFSETELANIWMDGTSIQEPPEDFKEFEEQKLSCICPKCGYEFDE